MFQRVVLAGAVSVAVRVRPVPLMALRVPFVMVMSPTLPSQLNEVPGSSEKVKVTRLVLTLDTMFRLMVMLTLGAWVSMRMVGAELATKLAFSA